jgi:dipeptidyl aminopeptidase/acylaminoacyl peptidase
MAVLSALRPGDERYGAIPLADAAAEDASLAYAIACWPVLDPFARYEYARRVGRAELVERSEGYFRSTEAMQEASPRLLLERGERTALPPTLIVYGDADANVPVEIIEGFTVAYRGAGGQVDLAFFPGAVHGFGNRPGADTDRMIEVMKRFVALQLA